MRHRIRLGPARGDGTGAASVSSLGSVRAFGTPTFGAALTALDAPYGPTPRGRPLSRRRRSGHTPTARSGAKLHLDDGIADGGDESEVGIMGSNRLAHAMIRVPDVNATVAYWEGRGATVSSYRRNPSAETAFITLGDGKSESPKVGGGVLLSGGHEPPTGRGASAGKRRLVLRPIDADRFSEQYGRRCGGGQAAEAVD